MESTGRTQLSVSSEQMVACGVSDVGQQRSENEDSIYLDSAGKFVLLADGMGGHERGAEASRAAVEIPNPPSRPGTGNRQLRDRGCNRRLV